MGNGAYTPNRFHHRRQGGFTLIEAMIALTVASILLSAAVPSLQDFIIRNQMSTEVNSFVASLYLARSEAVKRMQDVAICPTTDFTTCAASAADWAPGWMVFSDANNNGTVDGNDVILQQDAKLPDGFLATGSNGNRAVFASNGMVASTGGGFGNMTVTFQDCKGVANTRTVVLSQEGRVRTTELNTSGGCP